MVRTANGGEVMELIQPTMYWVAQMYGELSRVSCGNYEGFKAEPDHVFTYRERMVEVFGKKSVKELGDSGSLNMVELSDRCEAVASALWIMLDEGDERVNNELEDVAFWSGEVFRSIEVVRKMLKLFGWEDQVEVDNLINDAGADYVGTRAEIR